MKIKYLYLISFFVFPSLLLSQNKYYINGTVVDSKTLLGIPDVNLYLPDLKSGVSTKKDGSFRLKINDENEIQLFISHIAYISKNMSINNQMNKITIKLDENFFISEDIVVTGTKSNKIYKNSPIATEVISKRDLENSAALNIKDLLLTQSGISESPSVYGGYDATIQGMDSKNILFLIDGQPITGKFYNRVSLDQISINNIEKIEITKGPSSSLYGSSSMGGTINILTKSIINKNKIFWEINNTSPITENNKYTIGSNNYVLGINRKIGDVNIMSTINNEKIFSKKIIKESDIDETNKQTIHANSTWKINENNKLKFNVNHYLQNEIGQSLLINTSTKINRTNYIINHKKLNKNGWNYNQSINYQNYKRTYVEKWIHNNEIETNDLSKENSHEYKFSINKKNHGNEINVGLELSKIQYQNNRVNENEYNLNAQSIFTQYDMEILNDYNIILGLRLDKYSTYNIVYSPRIAVMKTLDRWKFRTSIGKGFRAPSFMEKFLNYNHATFGYKVQGNENLLPEKSFGGTLGAEYLHPNTYQISVLFHYVKFIDHIMENNLGKINDSDLITYSYHNINNVYNGLEIRGKWKVTSTSSASWEINFMNNKDDDGKSIPNSPPLTICNGYDYKSPKFPFGLTINTKWTQSYRPAYHDIINNEWIYDDKRKSFMVIDVFANYLIKESIKINIGFTNITNYTNDTYGPFTKKTLFLKLKHEF
ncbi:MAG: TonB-dependent receptor [Candidatus Neomarinimicrobiota bacterium]|nr:TonB-dependent receptor [Candidatus Neomarinimicrobiota bacterium]